MMWGRSYWLYDVVFELESSHPDIVASMLKFSTAGYPIDAAGRVTSTTTGRVKWQPKDDEITQTFADYNQAAPSAAAISIVLFESFVSYSQPFAAYEAPAAILDLVLAEPSGAIAKSYRNYIRSVFLPGIRKVRDILERHSATIEMPSKEWYVLP